jgi:predicted RNase H-like nuclease (RuvC/YqgF family)
MPEQEHKALQECPQISNTGLIDLTRKESKDKDSSQDMTTVRNFLIAKISPLENELEEKNAEIAGLKNKMKEVSKVYGAEISDLIELESVESFRSLSTGIFSLFARTGEKDKQTLFASKK